LARTKSLRLRSLGAAFALTCLFLVTGCGESGPTVVPVTGIVLHKGQPVPNLYLNFVPETGRPSWAASDAQGRFKVNYTAEQDGAVVGKHTVVVQYKPSSMEAELEMLAGTLKKPAGLDEILTKYGNEGTSTKTIEITPDTREIELVLD
jgi:hypothetical protein